MVAAASFRNIVEQRGDQISSGWGSRGQRSTHSGWRWRSFFRKALQFEHYADGVFIHRVCV